MIGPSHNWPLVLLYFVRCLLLAMFTILSCAFFLCFFFLFILVVPMRKCRLVVCRAKVPHVFLCVVHELCCVLFTSSTCCVACRARVVLCVVHELYCVSCTSCIVCRARVVLCVVHELYCVSCKSCVVHELLCVVHELYCVSCTSCVVCYARVVFQVPHVVLCVVRRARITHSYIINLTGACFFPLVQIVLA